MQTISAPGHAGRDGFAAPVVHADKRAATSFSHRHKKAVVAVAHAILVTAYHLLGRQTTPGADYHRHAERVRHRAIQTLERQGYRVTHEAAA